MFWLCARRVSNTVLHLGMRDIGGSSKQAELAVHIGRIQQIKFFYISLLQSIACLLWCMITTSFQR